MAESFIDSEDFQSFDEDMQQEALNELFKCLNEVNRLRAGGHSKELVDAMIHSGALGMTVK